MKLIALGGVIVALIDLQKLEGWLQPHSLEWYQQLGKLEGGYQYSWNSTIQETNGEAIFDREVVRIIEDKTVLDIGCADGKWTIQFSENAKKIVGFDVTEPFIRKANENKTNNTSFIVGSSKEPLPFYSEEFDCAYIRKGPTSGYLSLNQIVKKGGEIMGLHPGDEMGKELSTLFPDLFDYTEGTPILESLSKNLKKSNFTFAFIQKVNCIEFLHTPLDVFKLRCFGQNQEIYNLLVHEYLPEVTKIFEKNASKEGLPITNSYYIVRAAV